MKVSGTDTVMKGEAGSEFTVLWRRELPGLRMNIDSGVHCSFHFSGHPHKGQRKLPLAFANPCDPGCILCQAALLDSTVSETPSILTVCVCVCVRAHVCAPARLLCSRNSPGKNTGVVCHFLLQWIFLTQGLNPGLLHCWQILYHLSHWGSPFLLGCAPAQGSWEAPPAVEKSLCLGLF